MISLLSFFIQFPCFFFFTGDQGVLDWILMFLVIRDEDGTARTEGNIRVGTETVRDAL